MKKLADLAAPTVIVHEMSEAELQDKCVRWYRSRSEKYHWARKFSSMSQRSVPDYLFGEHSTHMYSRCGATRFATEFKKPGHKYKLIEKYGVTVMSTESQYEEQLAMRWAGWFVFECDDFEFFKKTVLDYERQELSK